MGNVSIGSQLLKTVGISAVCLDLAKLQLKNRKKYVFLFEIRNFIFPTLKIVVFAKDNIYLYKYIYHISTYLFEFF